jgi:hypothetical protein
MKIDDVPKPEPQASGGVVVEVFAARVLSYAQDVVSRKLAFYSLPEVRSIENEE